MGAIADVVAFGSAGRLRLWVWATLVALLGTQLLQSAGVLDVSSATPLAPRIPLLSLVVGGLAFGVGMVLASGCPSRALVRTGGGSLKALTVLLIAGLGAQMTLRGVLAAPRVELLDIAIVSLPTSQDLPSLLAHATGQSTRMLRLGLCLAIAVGSIAWLARDRAFLRLEPLIGGLLIGALVGASWYVTGELAYLPEHPETLQQAWLGTQTHRPEALSFVAPTAHALDLLTLWSDSNTRLTFGVAVLLGVVAGSLAAAIARREFRLEGFSNAQDMRRHAIGALLMGAGGVTALGCSIGQGVSGLSLLSAGSVVAVAAIVLGAVGALRYLASRA